MVPGGLNNQLGIVEGGIDFRAKGDSLVCFCGIFEQLFRELHCPGGVRCPAVELAIDKIGASTEKQPDRRRDHEGVAKIHPGKLMPVRVIKTEQQNANHAAVTRHSALPYAQERERFV